MSAKRDLAQAKLAPCKRNIFVYVQAGSLVMCSLEAVAMCWLDPWLLELP